MGALRQTNFGGGEIAPMGWGRNDLPFFSRGLRTMRNFFPTRQHGSAVSRPGSQHITTTRDPLDDSARLIPFVYSDSESFCIEVGVTSGLNLYFRFFTEGAALLDNLGTSPYELIAGTVAADIDLGLLKWAQSGNVLTLTHPDFPAQELRRLADWDAAAINTVTAKAKAAGEAAAHTAWFNSLPTADIEAAYAAAFRVVWGNDANAQGADAPSHILGLVAQAAVTVPPAIYSDANTAYANAYSTAYSGLILGGPRWSLSNVTFKRADPYFNPTSTAGSYPVILSPLNTPDVIHPAREWVYLCSLTVRDTTTGALYETLPWRVTESWDGDVSHAPVLLADSQVAVFPDMPVTIKRGAHLQLSAANLVNLGFVEVAMNVYRGRAQLFGLVGTTDTDTFVDVGVEPDWVTQPYMGTNPFKTTDYLGNATYGNPRALCYFQDRLVFLATEVRPAAVFASATGDYNVFDLPQLVHYAGESLLFNLAARKFEQGRHLVAHEKMIIGTKSSAWSMAGSGGPLDFDSVEAKVIDEVGMTDLTPLMLEGFVIYARSKGNGVRGLKYDGRFGTYSALELSDQSAHLFIGDSVGFQGATTNRTLVDWTYAEDPWGVVWAVRADGMLLSLTLKGGEYGWARHDGNPTTLSLGAGTPATYRRVCAVPEGDEDAVYMLVTRAIAGSYATTCVERMASRVRRGNNNDDCCVDSAVTYFGVPKTHITSDDVPLLGHLWSESVWVIGTGNAPQGPYVVDRVETAPGNNTVFPPVPPTYQYFVDVAEMPIANDNVGNVQLFIGLLFTPDLELLDVVSADSKLKQKTVTRVGFELDESAGILGGQDFDHLTESEPNTVATGYSAPVPGTSLVLITPERKWDNGGRAVLRQSLPLPVTVVGAVRELEIGG